MSLVDKKHINQKDDDENYLERMNKLSMRSKEPGIPAECAGARWLRH